MSFPAKSIKILQNNRWKNDELGIEVMLWLFFPDIQTIKLYVRDHEQWEVGNKVQIMKGWIEELQKRPEFAKLDFTIKMFRGFIRNQTVKFEEAFRLATELGIDNEYDACPDNRFVLVSRPDSTKTPAQRIRNICQFYDYLYPVLSLRPVDMPQSNIPLASAVESPSLESLSSEPSSSPSPSISSTGDSSCSSQSSRGSPEATTSSPIDYSVCNFTQCFSGISVFPPAQEDLQTSDGRFLYTSIRAKTSFPPLPYLIPNSDPSSPDFSPTPRDTINCVDSIPCAKLAEELEMLDVAGGDDSDLSKSATVDGTTKLFGVANSKDQESSNSLNMYNQYLTAVKTRKRRLQEASKTQLETTLARARECVGVPQSQNIGPEAGLTAKPGVTRLLELRRSRKTPTILPVPREDPSSLVINVLSTTAISQQKQKLSEIRDSVIFDVSLRSQKNNPSRLREIIDQLQQLLRSLEALEDRTTNDLMQLRSMALAVQSLCRARLKLCNSSCSIFNLRSTFKSDSELRKERLERTGFNKTQILTSWSLENPQRLSPNKYDKERLAESCRMSIQEVEKWFLNRSRRTSVRRGIKMRLK
jgi:Homeobox KN domain